MAALMGNLRIFHSGKMATDSKPYFAEAIAVEEGKILSVGGNSEILRLKRTETESDEDFAHFIWHRFVFSDFCMS
jgi:predicted amidohydrolase YtcJ